MKSVSPSSGPSKSFERKIHMKIPTFVVSSRRFASNSLVVCLMAAAAGGSSVSQMRVVTKKDIAVITYKSIPEATEPCTPEESEWWKQIRKAGNDLQKKSDAKSEARFLLLLSEEQQKAYRIPLKDRPHQTLALRPSADFAGKNNKMNETVVLSVEFRLDGSVGDVRITRGAEFVIEENVIQATRQYAFLPAIKNGAFVTERNDIELRLWSK